MIELDRIKVLIIDDSKENRIRVSDILSKVEYITLVGEAENLDNALLIIDETNPDIILVDSNILGSGYEISEKIILDFPDANIIMVEKELKEDTMYKSIFAGAKDVIIHPYSPSKLVDSIYRTYQLSKKREVIHRDTTIKTRRKTGKGNVITVFSTKGGVGKTFVSTNLAIALGKLTDKRVVLVDLDLDFGNTVLALNIVPRFTILDIVDDIRNIDSDLIESYLISHESGIKVLPANAQPQINEFINSSHVEVILRALQGSFDYVVIDMPARFYEPANPAFQFADILLMVTTPEISTIRNIKSSISTLHELNYPKSKIKVILNKSNPKSQIRTKDVETTLNQSIYGIIDEDYKLASLSLNSGNPVVMYKPRSGISKSFNNLAKKIASESRNSQ